MGSAAAGPQTTQQSDIVAQARAAVRAYTGKVDSGVPKASNPAAAGKSVAIISCLQAAEGCARSTRGAAEAARAIGWRATVYDGKGTPDGQNTAFANALTADPDAVLLIVIDAQVVASQIQRARSQGVKVIGVSGIDTPGRIFDAAAGGTLAAATRDGKAVADYVIANSNGRAKVALFRGDDFLAVAARGNGFQKEFARCRTCSIATTEKFTVTEFTTRLPTLAVNAVRRDPSINWVVGTYDIATESILAGLRQAGLDRRVRLVSFDGNASTLALIRAKGPLKATAAIQAECFGWAGVDAANSLLRGVRPSTGGACVKGAKLIVAGNAPKAGNWQGDTGFRGAWRKRWGR